MTMADKSSEELHNEARELHSDAAKQRAVGAGTVLGALLVGTAVGGPIGGVIGLAASAVASGALLRALQNERKAEQIKEEASPVEVSGSRIGSEDADFRQPVPSDSDIPDSDIPDLIRKLAELKEAGVIEEDEFEAKKKDLLDRL